MNLKLYKCKAFRGGAFLICVLVVCLNFTSCKSVSKAIGDPEVYLYKGQANLMNGTYFTDPYEYSGDYKLLTEIFELEPQHFSNKVEFKFLDDEHLEISYSDGLEQKTKVVKGKMKNGGFRYEYKNLPIGIPLIFFNYTFKVHHMALGNDDNIIITEYENSVSHFFLLPGGYKIENRYYFDRQLK